MPVGRKSRFPICLLSNKNFAKRNRDSLLFAAFVLPSYHSSLPSGESFVPIGGATRDHHHHQQHHHHPHRSDPHEYRLKLWAAAFYSLLALPCDICLTGLTRDLSLCLGLKALIFRQETRNSIHTLSGSLGAKNKRLIEETSFICLSG